VLTVPGQLQHGWMAGAKMVILNFKRKGRMDALGQVIGHTSL